MPSEEQLRRAEARLSSMMSSEQAAVFTLKEALLDVMTRDGKADWASVETELISGLDRSTGLTKQRLAAAIDHLRQLSGKGA